MANISFQVGNDLIYALIKAGLDETTAKRVIESKGNALATLIVETIRKARENKSVTSEDRAREIMGKNFFGISDARSDLGIKNTQPEYYDVPFSEQTLYSCRESHLLVAVFPVSIAGMIRPKPFLNDIIDIKSCFLGPFLQDYGPFSWQLLKKDVLLGSTYKSWEQQKDLILDFEEIPEARVLIYAIISYLIKTNELLFRNIYVRCIDKRYFNQHVIVGGSDNGFIIDSVRDDDFLGNVGITTARKKGV